MKLQDILSANRIYYGPIVMLLSILAAPSHSTGAYVDLSSFTAVEYRTGDQPSTARWIVSQDGFSVTQNNNNEPSIFLSDFGVSNSIVEFDFRVDSSDDDALGFVWGWQEYGNFYMLNWVNSFQGGVISIGQATGGAASPIWNDHWADWNFQTQRRWDNRTEYHVSLSFEPGNTVIEITQGNTSVARYVVTDASYRFGRFGFFTGSLGKVRFRNLSILPLVKNKPCLNIIYVDDATPDDLGSNDLTIYDREEDGTAEHPFDTIQEGIEAACEGATVFVRGGTYHENIQLRGKNIHVTSFDPNMSAPHSYPVIDGGYSGPVVTFNQFEDPNCRLSGFVLTGGLGEPPSSLVSNTAFGAASAIACLNASPTISHCLIVGNRCPEPVRASAPGGIVYCVTSKAVFENCTIVDNYAGAGGAGLYFLLSEATILNCIIRANSPEQILVASGKDPIIAYSNIQGTWPGFGNIDEDAHFAYRGYWGDAEHVDLSMVEPSHPNAIWIEGDYHLMSRSGHWDVFSEAWVRDKNSSLSIDAGDPNSLLETEPSPNGERVNQGAYGGTLQASKTPIDCSMTVESGPGGSVVTPIDSPVVRDCGTRVPIEAKPDPCHEFIEWLGDAVEDGKVEDPISPRTTVVLDDDYYLTANFQLIEYSMTTTSSEGGFVANPGEGANLYKCGDIVTLVASSEPCFEFTYWSGTAVDAGKVADVSSPITTVTVDSDCILIANFQRIQDEFTITTSSTIGGRVTDPGEGPFLRKCEVPIGVRITQQCYQFTGWTGTAVEAGRVADPNDPDTVVYVDADYTLVANFEFVKDRLIESASEGGSVHRVGESRQYICENLVFLEARAEPCYRFIGWTGTAVDAGLLTEKDLSDPTINFIVDAEYTLIANFELIRYTLTVSSSEGGSVTKPGEGEHLIDCATDLLEIVAVPEQGYRFVHWRGTAVDEGKVANKDAANTTVFVDGEYTLTAHFEPLP